MPVHQEVRNYEFRYSSQSRCDVGDGIELYYEMRGAGAPLTLVNNMFLISPLWRSFTGRLEEHRTLLTYDLRNQGASSSFDGDITIAHHVEDLRRLLDNLGIERTLLLGTSVSTLIARDFATRYPERVSGLILVGPSFSAFGSRRRELLVKSWIRALDAHGPAGLFGNIYPQVFGDKIISENAAAGYLALKERFLAVASHQQIRANLIASLTTVDDPAALDGLTCPILLLAGDGDFLASRSSLEEMAQRLPEARVDVIPYAGHIPFFDDPDAFQDSIERFLKEIGNEGAK